MTRYRRPPASLRLERRQLLALGGALALGVAGPARAQAWPNGTVTLIVPSSPGSGPDVLARALAERLGATTKATVIVENKAGANGILGSDAVAKSAPTGQTLLLYDRLTMAVNPVLYAKMPFKPTDLIGISDVAGVNLVYVCRADAPYKTWGEMVAHARSKPGTMTVGTAGRGSVHHLSLEMIERQLGLDMTDIPYRGIAPAVRGLLAGEIDGVITGQETVLEHIRAGKLRALAIGADQRSPLLPQVPTLKEVGAPPDLLIPTSFTLFAPAGTPAATVQRIHAAVTTALQDPTLVQRFGDRGLIISPSSPAQVDAALARESERYAKLIREAKITLE